MTRNVDILDEKDSVKGSFAGSLVLHALVGGLITFFTVYEPQGKKTQWGSQDAGAGQAVAVSSVKSLPFYSPPAPVNRVANDTESMVPQETKPEPKAKPAVKEERDAIPIPTKQKEKEKRKAEQNRPLPLKTPTRQEPNQLTSRAGAQAASPLFAPAPGSGGVGIGTGAPFGYQFGAYAALVRDRVAAKWRTDGVPGNIRFLPLATVTFEIMRDGRVKNVEVVQSSGNRALDYSAQRAVTEASPFPPLPAAYSGSSATVEFSFRLQR